MLIKVEAKGATAAHCNKQACISIKTRVERFSTAGACPLFLLEHDGHLGACVYCVLVVQQ